MGGHGGLNILPQKSWNVYGHKQRQRVKRDEERAAEEENAALEARLQELRDERLGQLRDRALKRRRDGDGEGDDAADRGAHPSSISTTAGAEHINFFAVEEEALAAQELKEKREALAAGGGGPGRKDDSSRLGYGTSDPVPWYAKKGSSFFVDSKQSAHNLPARIRREKEEIAAIKSSTSRSSHLQSQRQSSQLAATTTTATAAAAAATASTRTLLPGVAATEAAAPLRGYDHARLGYGKTERRVDDDDDDDDHDDDESDGKRGKRSRKDKERERKDERMRKSKKRGKEKKRDKKSKRSGDGDGGSGGGRALPGGGVPKSILELRKERMMREQAERKKERVIVAGSYC